MVALQFGSVIQESQTNDEGVHLASGYSYWVAGDYRMDPTHPAFARMLAALPMLFMKLDSHLDSEAWNHSQAVKYADLLLYNNRIPADKIWLCCRSVIIALTALLGIWMAWWTRKHFGSNIALLALVLFSFDPNLIAHGRYVTTDLPVTLFIFLTCTLWADFLSAPSTKKLLLASVALGLALATKYSAIFLIPVLPTVYCVAWFSKRARRSLSLRKFISTVAVMNVVAVSVVALVYAPEVIGSIHFLKTGVAPANIAVRPLASRLPQNKILGRVLARTVSTIHLPSYRYLIGLGYQTRQGLTGHPAYLLGHFSNDGWRMYFPVAFLVKTPTATLLACIFALAAVLVVRRPPRKGDLILWISIPPIVYFALSMVSHLDIGVRHILPVYPFLYVILAIAVCDYVRPVLRKWFLLTVVILVTTLAVESLAIYPDYLSFFNWASGGPDNGSRYLLDSNIDWGQNVKKLSRYLAKNSLYPVCPAIFGNGQTQLDYYGVSPHARGWPIVRTDWSSDCVAAVSINFLRGVFVSEKAFATLRQRQPDAIVGHSIYIYDLRSKHNR